MPKIVELNVNFISLVDHPANMKPLIYKSDDGKQMLNIPIRIVKAETQEEGLIYGVVYEPDSLDSQGDWADAATIKRAAHDFVKKGKVQMVDLQHNYEPFSGAVVESHILAGKNANYPNVKEGAWVVTIEPDDAAKEMVKSGKIGGLSLAGTATFDSESAKSDSPSNTSKTTSKDPVDGSARILKKDAGRPARIHSPARIKTK